MTSLRQAIATSWYPELRLLRSDMARAMQLAEPLSLTQLVAVLGTPEAITRTADVRAKGIRGNVVFTIRSDGSYSFQGRLRATGLFSFAYKLQATFHCGGAVVIVVETTGRVFGDDTPGDSARRWDENGISAPIRDYWAALRLAPELATNLEKNMSGVTGALVDVAETVVETYVGAQFAGVIGAVIVIGSVLGTKMGTTFRNPNMLAGVTVGAGMLLVFGPGAIIPALAAGTLTAALTGIRSRPMNDEEIIFVQRVFHDTLPLDRIIITDMCNPSDTETGTMLVEFTTLAIDGTILVNMGRNFDNTLGVDRNTDIGRQAYTKPGQVFIHELVHAWQISHHAFLPGLLCQALTSDGYTVDGERIKRREPWSGPFDLEAQAAIIDTWFGAFDRDINSREALSDPSFFYVANNLRLNRT